MLSFERRMHLLRVGFLLTVGAGSAWLLAQGFTIPSAVLLGMGVVKARQWVWPLLAGIVAIYAARRRVTSGPFALQLPWRWSVTSGERPELLALDGPGVLLQAFLVPAGKQAAVLERLAASMRTRLSVRSEAALQGNLAGRPAAGTRWCATSWREAGVLELLSCELGDGRALAVMSWRELWASALVVHHAAATLELAPREPAPPAS